MLFDVPQATDVPEHEFDIQADEKETAENKQRNKDDAIPERFACYELLMNAKPNPDVVEPVGEDSSFTCSLLFLYIFLQALKKFGDTITPQRRVFISSFNRNSNSCSDAGTHTEDS